MKKLMIVFFALFSVSIANAALRTMVCEGTTNWGNKKVTLTVKGTVVEIKCIDRAKLVTFENVANAWDGHMTGLMTAKGLSIEYTDGDGFMQHLSVIAQIPAGDEGGDSDSLIHAKFPHCEPPHE